MTVAVPSDVRPLPALLTQTLPELLRDQQALEVMQQTVQAVDGAIVGTGKADFTQSNVAYRFEYNGKSFQLLDVPGIEGEETKYEAMVHQAIAKAHLVFYINGTNKKPESETVRKIRRYLSRDALVCAICNVRGHPDAYEFDEDREDLDQTHGDAPVNRKQTRETLGAVLGPDLLKDCLSVQGLLAFSSLAYTEIGSSSISPDRPDLRRTQARYARDFGTRDEMRRFSRIDCIADMIRHSAQTFESDIVDSNKRKVLRLLDDTIAEIESSLGAHKNLSAHISEEVEAYKDSVRNAGRQFAKRFKYKSRARVNVYFNTIRASVLDALETHDLDKDLVEATASKVQKDENEKLSADIKKIEEEETVELIARLEEAKQRLEVDLKRVRFEQQLFTASGSAVSLTDALEAMDFDIGDFGSFIGSIASWASAGFAVGSWLPVIGNAIGAAVGAALGAVISALKYFFFSRASKIRDAQSKASRVIEEKREEALRALDKELLELEDNVNNALKNDVIDIVQKEIDSMARSHEILELALQTFIGFRFQVKGENYGKL